MANDLEVTASYWEARIKTYGFHRVIGLSLFDLILDVLALPSFGKAICRMGDEGVPVVLTFSQHTAQRLSVCFVVPTGFEGRVRGRLQEEVRAGGAGVARIVPVEVVYFYGPHFGDRYGIAEAALRALAESGICVTAIACSGSCIYLVLLEGESEEAVRALSRSFEIPKTMSQKAAVAN